MRCSYCYNADIVYAKNGKLSFNNVLDFLKLRVGRLDAVVLSGGEATTHDLIEFCQEIKKLGFKIKLDTNGSNPKQIKILHQLNLVDYIALDYKAPEAKFSYITKSHKYNDFSDSLDFLIKSNLNFEVRTTLHADLLNEDDINKIIDDLQAREYFNNYYIQEFTETKKNIANLSKPKYKFDKTLISKDLNVIYR